jgi:hypothetical protein
LVITDYQIPFTTQQAPVLNGQESTSDDLLYHQIMQDAMCYAPTLTRDLELPILDETFELPEHHHSSPPPAGIHRRSYILATRQDSSKGKNRYIFFYYSSVTSNLLNIL